VPDQVLSKLETLFWRFLWGNGREKVKRHVCMRKVNEGGLDMPDLRKLIIANRLKFVVRVVNGRNEKWEFLPRGFLKKI
jgi:hypothetical protein